MGEKSPPLKGEVSEANRGMNTPPPEASGPYSPQRENFYSAPPTNPIIKKKQQHHTKKITK